MKFLNFALNHQEFGIPLELVREVIAFPEISSIPSVSKDFLGITNLRDQIIPIHDLRIKFDIEPTLTYETAVVICEVDNRHVGIVVDLIRTVIAPDDSDVMNLSLGESPDSAAASVSQVVKYEGKLVVLINVAKVITSVPADIAAMKDAIETMKMVA